MLALQTELDSNDGGDRDGERSQIVSCFHYLDGLDRARDFQLQLVGLDGVIDAPPADALSPYMSDAGRQGALDLALAAGSLRRTWAHPTSSPRSSTTSAGIRRSRRRSQRRRLTPR